LNFEKSGRADDEMNLTLRIHSISLWGHLFIKTICNDRFFHASTTVSGFMRIVEATHRIAGSKCAASPEKAPSVLVGVSSVDIKTALRWESSSNQFCDHGIATMDDRSPIV
jgi:hypothetical protein